MEEKVCKSANDLRLVGKVTLILTIIGAFIAFCCTVVITVPVPNTQWLTHEVFNPNSLAYLAIPILLAIIIRAFARAVADNTENIQKMANKGEKIEEVV